MKRVSALLSKPPPPPPSAGKRSAGREWTTRLTFPGARLGSAWIEGAPQGTAQRIDDGFTYRSGGDLPGGASVTLRFYVQGTQSRPTSCTIDGVSCRL